MKSLSMKRMKGIGLGILGLCVLPSLALACPEGGVEGGSQRGSRRGPPPEAIEACAGAGVDEACEFQAPHGTVTGTCRSIQNQVICAPEGGPPASPDQIGQLQRDF